MFSLNFLFYVQNCNFEDGPFQDKPVTNISYTIVSRHSACMHYVWSMKGNLTLYLAHTTGHENCNCSSSMMKFSLANFPEDGSIGSPALNKSDFSLAVVFTRIIEFDATDGNLAVSGLNLSAVCNEDEHTNHTYKQFLFDNDTKWEFIAKESTFVGTWHNMSAVNHTATQTRFKIRVSESGFRDVGYLGYACG